MIFAAFTFALCLTIVLGVYWYMVVRPEKLESRVVASRVRNLSVPSVGAKAVTWEETKVSAIPALEVILKRHAGFTTTIETMLREADVKMTPGLFLSLSLASAAAGWAIGLLLLGYLVAAILLAPIGAILPFMIVSTKRTKRLQVFEEQFPEAIDLIARSLRAGHAFTTGLSIAADELPAPVGAEFKKVFDQQNFGMSMVEALHGMAARVPVLDARFFVTAVLTQREAGGNLAEILDNLANVMRERFKVKRQIRVISAHGRLSGWILSLLPPALAFVLFLMQPDYMRLLVDDPVGVQLVIAAICLQAIGMYIISKLVRIEY